MPTVKELNDIFDQVKELIGVGPSEYTLRNAIHAFITEEILRMSSDFMTWNYIGADIKGRKGKRIKGKRKILNKVEYLSNQYRCYRWNNNLRSF